MASTRLPGKPLADICGKPMVQWVYERASAAARVNEVIVATPDREIADAVRSFGGRAVMTSPDHRSGTDRLAEAASAFADDEIVLNVQGDEPLVHPEAIEALIDPLLADDPPEISSLMRRIEPVEASDPNLVKVVVDKHGRALYFSRSPIPFIRNDHPNLRVYGHVGLYGYQVRALKDFSRLEPTPLEIAESLEQLRALENGWRIQMIETDFRPLGVDTKKDLDNVRKLIRSVNRS
jgi:3-deoxy-manno-octulosonate cytidylyltransferase (CMP-KDO synthetase)